ncbi:unnamed protein product [Caenorhabditis sp. 36 PRJEB53466]|nr:unnamed protein product [Caenorhabditis sp. 36 PRJEB53466]
MAVCRRIFKSYTPTELTICVTICCEPRVAPRFGQWSISRAGCPPRIIPCSRGATSSSSTSEESSRKVRRKVVKKKKEKKEAEEEQILLHSDSATLISDDVATAEVSDDVAVTRHVSITSLDSVAGLGGANSEDDVAKRAHSEDVRREDPEENVKRDLKTAKSGFDLLLGDVAIGKIERMDSVEEQPKKVMVRRKKKKEKTPPSEARYRDFTETSIFMYVEMNKQNLGEFVWDQQCTRIDALIAPVLELDRNTTPEVPVEIDILP